MTFSIDELAGVVGADNVRLSVPMKAWTTFRAGGPADYFITPENILQLSAVLRILKERKIPFFILGRGSNLLVSDSGYRGAVISLRKNMNRIDVNGEEIEAEGGAMLSEIAKRACQAGLGGFEFASGIPGTIGGGLVMNAGAYGSELKNVVKEALLLLPDGTLRRYSNEELELSYRHSIIEALDAVVLSVRIGLCRDNVENIAALMEDLNARRREKQPLEYGSAGSTFKRPAGFFAGKLIEDAGMKGFMIGEAGVSEKHAGFVVNKGNASAAEIYEVIVKTAERVYETSGVRLETEVKFLGDFS